jgi:hypothetical protein
MPAPDCDVRRAYADAMRVHQCPKCELRFSDEHEVKQHLIDDHGVDPEEFDRFGAHRPDVHPHRDAPHPGDTSN